MSYETRCLGSECPTHRELSEKLADTQHAFRDLLGIEFACNEHRDELGEPAYVGCPPLEVEADHLTQPVIDSSTSATFQTIHDAVTGGGY